MKILMVCLGNICRSPLAEGIMQQKSTEAGLDWEIDSAGTGEWHIGNQPDERSIAVARKNGLDISTQRARQFRESDFQDFDHILVMDSSNYNDVLSLAQTEEDKSKVELIMNFVQPGFNQKVPDPYWDDNGFDKVYAMLDEACEQFISQISTS